jgi:hypothetical protein
MLFVGHELTEFKRRPSVEMPMCKFIWDSQDAPGIRKLKARLNLTAIEEPVLTEFDRLVRACRLVQGLWNHDGATAADSEDPNQILDEVAAGKRFRCAEYAVILRACLAAIGMPARQLVLMTEDADVRETAASHIAVEVFLRDCAQWAFADPQFAALPLLNGRPASGAQLRQAVACSEPSLRLAGHSREESVVYFEWLAPYLFYLMSRFDNRTLGEADLTTLMLVPEGAKELRVFQLRWPIGAVVYVRSAAEFYPASVM